MQEKSDPFGARRRELLCGLAVAAPLWQAQAMAEGPSAVAAPRAADEVLIDRAFVRVREGLVHYRHAGLTNRFAATSRAPLPLYLAHAGPGSSRGMEGLIRVLGARRTCLAPDMLGNGDSAAPDRDQTDVAYYAECAMRVLDALGIERVDFYGAHTGAHIGCELALRWPDRVRRLIFDGIALFPADFRADLLANYAPPMRADDYGRQMLWAFQFVRDMSLHFPHYARDPAHRLANGVQPAEALHRSAVDVLKALTTYHLAYHAVFRHVVEERLPLLKLPVLCMTHEGDPLARYVDGAVQLVPGGRKAYLTREQGIAGTATAIDEFLS